MGCGVVLSDLNAVLRQIPSQLLHVLVCFGRLCVDGEYFANLSLPCLIECDVVALITTALSDGAAFGYSDLWLFSSLPAELDASTS